MQSICSHMSTSHTFLLIVGDRPCVGEYTASAAESATTFMLSEETIDARRRARRSAAQQVLSKPIQELVKMSEIEMALVRDAVWSAVQEFRLPHETTLVDKLYDEFGNQPFNILLPNQAVASRGDAPLFERGRSVCHPFLRSIYAIHFFFSLVYTCGSQVLQSIIERFLVSDEWDTWAVNAGTPVKFSSVSAALNGDLSSSSGPIERSKAEQNPNNVWQPAQVHQQPKVEQPPTAQPPWDGWD